MTQQQQQPVQRMRDNNIDENDTTNDDLIYLDDGTAVVSVVVTDIVTDGFCIGMTVQCLVRKHQDKNEHSCWVVEQLAWMQDPHAELLRWYELISTEKMRTEQQQWGFPCSRITSDTILTLIQSDPKGCSIQDLAIVLDVKEASVATMLEELQLEGQIYCNKNGAFVPL
jgi:hypothetical protein